MLNSVDFYYFSPTGGTKKAGMAIASALAEVINPIDLGGKAVNNPTSEVVIVAAPVFAGRIPAIVSDKLAKLKGEGKKAITKVVYGVRAYEDALLELNDVMQNSGFDIIASASLIAQHSMVPEVGTGRPDAVDIAEIQNFAKRILTVLKSGKKCITVPGNHPYKNHMTVSATPVSLPACSFCGYCAAVCPTEAIAVTDEDVKTDLSKCILCMTCIAKCPKKARILPPQLKAGLAQKLGALKNVRRENEFFV